MSNYTGIDISNWQGSIDFSQVKNSGTQIVYRFLFTRIL